MKAIKSFLLLLFLLSSIDTWAQTGNWQTIATSDQSTPVARHEAAFVEAGGKFYLIGGRGMKPVNIYDPISNTWTSGSTPPIEIHHFQPIVWKGNIYVLGALTGKYPGETPIPNILIYYPKEDRWETGPQIPENRNRGAAGIVLHKQKLYFICGIKDGHRGDHKQWLDVYDLKKKTWQQLPDAPRARDHFQAIEAKGNIYLLGGRRTSTEGIPFGGTETAVDVYNIKSQSWTVLPNPLPTARAGNYAVLTGKEIIVMGGESPAHEHAHRETEALHIETNTWQTLAPMIQGRHGTGAILHNNRIYVASGSGNRGGGPELTSMEYFTRLK